MNSRDSTPERTNVLLEDLPAHVEEALIERAEASGRDPASEAADIIERHVEESCDGSI